MFSNLQKFGPEQKKFKNVAFLVFIQCVGNCVCAFFGNHLYLTIIIIDKFSQKSYQRQKRPNSIHSLRSHFRNLRRRHVVQQLRHSIRILSIHGPRQILQANSRYTFSLQFITSQVLFMGVLVFGKKQGWIKYLCVFLVTVGITIFMSDEIQNSKAGAETSAFGVLLLCMSLAMDGVTGPFQVIPMGITVIYGIRTTLYISINQVQLL